MLAPSLSVWGRILAEGSAFCLPSVVASVEWVYKWYVFLRVIVRMR